MKNEITIDIIFNEIMLVKSHPKTRNMTALIVEGEDDSNFFEKIISFKKCNLFGANGKKNVVDVINKLNQNNSLGILGIIDADLLYILHDETFFSTPNLLISDFHDIEMYLWLKIDINNILCEYCRIRELFENFKDVTNIRNKIEKNAEVIGMLRLISKKKSLKLVFKTLDYKKFLIMADLSIAIENLIAHLIQISRSNTFFLLDWENFKQLNELKDFSDLIEYLLNELNIELKNHYDSKQLCNGHDIMKILTDGIINQYCKIENRSYNYSSIEREFRLLYSKEDFLSTTLYEKMKKWEENNKPFTIFS